MSSAQQAAVTVVGGGAAGLFALAQLCRLTPRAEMILLEPNEKLGRKLRITGKGRCNVTNQCDLPELMAHIPENGKFLYSAFSRCMPRNVMDFFEEWGVPLKTERGRRVFPVSDRADDIADALVRQIRGRVRLMHRKAAELMLENGQCTGVICTDGTVIRSRCVLLATGGCSYPKTGADGSGYALARQAGHTIIPPAPSLIPLETREKWPAQAMGVSLRNVTLRLYRGEKLLYSELGELLFTHFGISGPLVLTASTYMRRGSAADYRVEIDLKPGLTPEQLDRRILRDLSENPKKIIGTVLHNLLPPKLIVPLLQQIDLPPETKCNVLTRAQRSQLCTLLKAVPLHIRAMRPIREAIITRGGVSLREVGAADMASKCCGGLYFAGEILDLDAQTGGYNLQIAFATANAAAQAIAEIIT